MTVKQLIQRLQTFPADTEVLALWDQMPSFQIHRVELFDGAALIDCGDGPEGDWEYLQRDAQHYSGPR